MNAVLRLLEWAWRMLTEQDPSHDLHYLAFVARSSLHLLQTYIQEAYPKQLRPGKRSKDCAELAEAVYQAQTILRSILSFRWRISPPPYLPGVEKEPSMMELVLEACCSVFRSCFHTFYPTKPLKWWALCQHLQLLDPVSQTSWCTLVVASECHVSCSIMSQSGHVHTNSPDDVCVCDGYCSKL